MSLQTTKTGGEVFWPREDRFGQESGTIRKKLVLSLNTTAALREPSGGIDRIGSFKLTVKIPGKDGFRTLEALVDSGVECNFISQRIVKEEDLPL